MEIPSNFFVLIAFLMVVMVLVVKLKKLTIPASIIGGVLALIIYMGTGFIGIIALATFFILGTCATSWKRSTKQNINVRDDAATTRNVSQVIANGGVGALMGLVAWFDPANVELYTLMLSASMASATADTLSSELGSVYGSNFYNIITLKTDKCGLDGVVSIEGTLIGIFGATVIGAIYAAAFEWNQNFIWITLAGAFGNLADSILGATLERKNIIKNDVVNFLNTLFAALFAGICYLIWLSI